MAENNPRVAGDDDLATEVANLKRELANLREALADRAGDIAQGAGRAASAVVQPIRDNPGTAGVLFGGLIGLLVGLTIGQAMSEQGTRPWYDRYR